VCLVALVSLMRAHGFRLLDIQFVNDHLLQFGCVEISRDDYLERLAAALAAAADWPAPGPLAEPRA
jgi:leucyl/phenylalanyl-tRNA--protein transferase